VKPVSQSVLSLLRIRRDDARSVLHLAYPVVLGSLSFTLLSFVDTLMVGRLGAARLAASGIAGVLYFAVVFSIAGLGIGVQTLTARRFGEGKRKDCGDVANVGLILAVAIGLPITMAGPWLARTLGTILSPDPLVVELGSTYLLYRFYGTALMLANWSLRGFFAGIGETRHVMIASVVTTAANLLLDYLLIFGIAGFPRLGIAGAAIASSLAIACGTIYLLTVALSRRHRSTFGILQPPFPLRRLTQPIVRLSLPVMGQRALASGSWYAFFTVVSFIGTVELAATNAIRSTYHLTIMLGVGLGTAAAALVGQRLGAANPDEAERLGWTAAKLGALAMGVVGILFLVVPAFFLRIFTSDPAVISTGRLPLFLLGFVQASAGVGLVLSQAIQGAGNTRFVMLAELAVCGTLYLPVVYLLGKVFGLGMIGAWTGEFLYWTSIAVVMTWKFRRGDWKHVKV